MRKKALLNMKKKHLFLIRTTTSFSLAIFFNAIVKIEFANALSVGNANSLIAAANPVIVYKAIEWATPFIGLLAFILYPILFTVGCVSLADEKNRNTVFWGWMGFLFGIIAYGILYIIPRKK